MPSAAEHVEVARQNSLTLAALKTASGSHAPWIATVAFYEALHIVDARLFFDGHDPIGHKDRFLVLRNQAYQPLWFHFQPLYNTSRIARYSSVTAFAQHIKPSEVENRLIRLHLAKIKAIVGPILKVKAVPFYWGSPASPGQ